MAITYTRNELEMKMGTYVIQESSVAWPTCAVRRGIGQIQFTDIVLHRIFVQDISFEFRNSRHVNREYFLQFE